MFSIFWGILLKCVFGRLPDHTLHDFGIIYEQFLKYFPLPFEAGENLEKINPSHAKTLFLRFWGQGFSLFFATNLKTNSRSYFGWIFCRFMTDLDTIFKHFGSLFGIRFSDLNLGSGFFPKLDFWTLRGKGGTLQMSLGYPSDIPGLVCCDLILDH